MEALGILHSFLKRVACGVLKTCGFGYIRGILGKVSAESFQSINCKKITVERRILSMEIFCLNSSLYLDIFEIFGGPEIASTLTCKLSSYVARLTILPPLKCFSLT